MWRLPFSAAGNGSFAEIKSLLFAKKGKAGATQNVHYVVFFGMASEQDPTNIATRVVQIFVGAGFKIRPSSLLD